MAGLFDWLGFGGGISPAGGETMFSGGADAPMSFAPTEPLHWGQGGGLLGSGASSGALGMPSMGLLRAGAALMSPDPNARSRAATALRQGAAFDQKIRKEFAAREAANAAGAPGANALPRGLEQALMLRLAALAETQRDQAAAPAPAASASAPSLRLSRPAVPGAAPAAGTAGRRAMAGSSGVSQRPAPPLRIRLDAQGRRIG